MSRLKLILSILLMLFLLLVAIFLPSRLREQRKHRIQSLKKRPLPRKKATSRRS